MIKLSSSDFAEGKTIFSGNIRCQVVTEELTFNCIALLNLYLIQNNSKTLLGRLKMDKALEKRLVRSVFGVLSSNSH